MKKWFYVSLIMAMLPLTMTAQDDDMYFVPKKNSAEHKAVNYSTPRSTYYSGSNRSVDEYNRHGGGSYYEVVSNDTTGNDIIDFSSEVGVYPDSAMQQQEDFTLTRQMSRWDGYEPEIAYLAGYNAGRFDSWHSPWYYSSYYPWYDSYWYWNDPWYYRHYGWYGGWYDPWYYDYYGYSPYWYGGWYGGYHYSYYRPYYGSYYYISSSNGSFRNRTHYDRGMVASTKRGVSNGRTTTHSAGTFGGAAINNRNTATRNSTYSRTNTTANRSMVTNSHGTFAGNRTLGSSTTTSSSSSANRSVGSFGGSSMSRSSSIGSSGSFGGGGGGGGVSTRGGSRSSRR